MLVERPEDGPRLALNMYFGSNETIWEGMRNFLRCMRLSVT